MKRRGMLALMTAALVPRPLFAAPRQRLERPLMGTLFSITCQHADAGFAAAAAAEAFQAAEAINAVASDYIADSELLALSKHPPGTAVPLSPLLFRLLAEARVLAETTGGLFDPTLGPLTKLWREARRRGRLPVPETLAAARKASGWQQLVLDPAKRTATFLEPGMRLDLGGIAKGQAADAMLAILRERGVARALITAGGDVLAGDPPEGGGGWKVAVRALDHGGESRVIELANAAVSTSGDLHQSIEIDGTRYSHVIDPATGLGLTRRAAATVEAATATLADALATAACVADPLHARDQVLQWGAREAVIATSD